MPNLYQKKQRFHIILQIVLFPVLILLDQISKLLAQNLLKGQPDVSVLSDAVTLHYLENTGAAFGIFQNRLWLFLLLSVFIFCVLLILFIRIHRKLSAYCTHADDPDYFQEKTFTRMMVLEYLFVILASGAIGNLIDRLFHGYVIDFIYLRFMQFPVFNLADIYVTVTAVLLIIFFIFFYKEDDHFKQ